MNLAQLHGMGVGEGVWVGGTWVGVGVGGAMVGVAVAVAGGAEVITARVGVAVAALGEAGATLVTFPGADWVNWATTVWAAWVYRPFGSGVAGLAVGKMAQAAEIKNNMVRTAMKELVFLDIKFSP
jgi:hypothetical protein